MLVLQRQVVAPRAMAVEKEAVDVARAAGEAEAAERMGKVAAAATVAAVAVSTLLRWCSVSKPCTGRDGMG